jgi:hypothetical protein
MSLNEQETNIIAETEALILKNIMSLPIYSLTSELYNALSLLFAKEHLRKIQLNFLVRLQQNEYTKKVTESLMENCHSNGLIEQIRKELKVENYNDLESKCSKELERLQKIVLERSSNCSKGKICARIMNNKSIEQHKKKVLLSNILHYDNK